MKRDAMLEETKDVAVSAVAISQRFMNSREQASSLLMRACRGKPTAAGKALRASASVPAPRRAALLSHARPLRWLQQTVPGW
jgi:hypothetical protein